MLAFHYRPMPAPYAPPTWADGTDAEIAEAVAKADAGEIDLTEYWAVGDERTVSLAAIPANSSGAFTKGVSAQNISFVIMNEGYMSQEGIHFVVGVKKFLADGGHTRMNVGNTNSGSWPNTKLRVALTSSTSGGLLYALPSDFQQIFKRFKVITASSYNGTTNQNDYNWFSLFAEKEMFGTQTNSNTTEANALSIIKYYETSSNRIKLPSGTAGGIWLRSPYNGDSKSFCVSWFNGMTCFSSYRNATEYNYASPFGCI